MPTKVYGPLIKPLKLISVDDQHAKILVPDEKLLSEVKALCRTTLQKKLSAAIGHKVSLEVMPVAKANNSPKVKSRRKSSKNEPASNVSNVHEFNINLTFENFIRSKSNELALDAAMSVCDTLGKATPLFIYGECGLGKTHLLHAIANSVAKKKHSKKILLITLPDIMQLKATPTQLRNTELLLVEDLHALKNTSESLQEEFYRIFNSFYDFSKQIVITADSPAANIAASSRLLSRFLSGLHVKVQKPDDDLVRAFLEQRAGENQLPLLLEMIQGKSISNLRELDSVIHKAEFLSNYGKEGMEALGQYLLDLFPSSATGPVSVDAIVAYVCEKFNTTKEEILSDTRKAEITFPRHLAMSLGIELSGLNKSAIARYFKRNDHTTVLNAEKKIRQRLKRDISFQRQYSRFKDDLLKGRAQV